MARCYGDIPCVKTGGIVHITASGNKCLCGQEWNYADPFADKRINLIWRGIEAVSCSACRSLYEASKDKMSNAEN